MTASKTVFNLGRLYARCILAQDDARWVTLHPNGKGEGKKGKAALIDTATGTILGGALAGRSVRNVKAGPTAEGEKAIEAFKKGGSKIANAKGPDRRSAKAPGASRAEIAATYSENRPEAPAPAKVTAGSTRAGKIDLSLPDRLDTSNVLQNRNRSTVGSIQQVQAIAAAPDFMRMGISHDFSSGAPVIAYGNYKPEQLGRKSIAVTPDGSRYAVQYAVVDASDVQTSNDANGQPNSAYYSDDPEMKRAIAGNGRMAAMRLAYQRGTTDNYRSEMMEMADEHGVSPDVIAKMKQPVLVRVMQPKDVTKDIGDKSNIQSGLQMSATEQAQNDKNRVNFDEVQTYSDGSPTKAAVKAFVMKMPVSERGSLIDADGQPTKQAQIRMQNALFAKAYENDDLIRQSAQAWDPDSKTIVNGLMRAAPKMQQLANLGDGYDVRDIVTKAALRAFNALENGQNLRTEAASADMFESGDEDSASRAVVQMFADATSAKGIADKLNAMADNLITASQQAGTVDLFGAVEVPPRDVLIKRALGQDGKPLRMSAAKAAFWREHGGTWLRSVFSGRLTEDSGAFLGLLGQVR